MCEYGETMKLTRKKLTIKSVFKQPHYTNILMLIADAQARKKKITFEKLKIILVKGIGDKLPDSKIKELRDFFQYAKPEIWPSQTGKPREVYSIVEFMSSIGKELEYEKQQISSINNLTNFLTKLIGLGLIERKPAGRKKPYYKITTKGIFYLKRYEINLEVEIFLDHVFDNKRSVQKSLKMLCVFESDIEKSIGKVISSR